MWGRYSWPVLFALLALLGCRRSAEPNRIVERLRSSSVAERLKGISEAKAHPDPAVRSELLELFTDAKEPAVVRGGAAMALGYMHDERLVSLALERLPEAVLKASKTVPPNNLEPYLLGRALVAYGPKSLESLSALLKNPHKEVVVWAIAQHGAYRYNDEALEVLARFLDDGDPVLRRAAAAGLAQSFHRRAEALALQHLDDPDPQVRFQLAWGLVNWGTAAAVGSLETRLASEKEPAVRQELAMALTAAKPRAARPAPPR